VRKILDALFLVLGVLFCAFAVVSMAAYALVFAVATVMGD